MNILLQILDDGRLTESSGRTVDFKNTVIIMTSNIGARMITEKKSLGFGNNSKDEENEYENTKKDVLQEVKKELKPELINRIDEIIVFHKLNEKEIENIIDIMLERIKTRLEKQKIELKIEDGVSKIIAKQGIDKAYGARPLRRTIQNLVENKLAEAILNDKAKSLILKAKDDKIVVEKN